MIRYINLGDDGFAWFNTVNNRFLSFWGEQAFDSFTHFTDCYNNRSLSEPPYRDIDQFAALITRRQHNE
jgi:hypothetical protein